VAGGKGAVKIQRKTKKKNEHPGGTHLKSKLVGNPFDGKKLPGQVQGGKQKTGVWDKGTARLLKAESLLGREGSNAGSGGKESTQRPKSKKPLNGRKVGKERTTGSGQSVLNYWGRGPERKSCTMERVHLGQEGEEGLEGWYIN